jgi:hypothetical protein
VALGQQIALGIVAMLLLDGGQTARNLACCIAAFWMSFLIIASRRPCLPTAVDLWLTRWSSIPIAMLAFTYR